MKKNTALSVHRGGMMKRPAMCSSVWMCLWMLCCFPYHSSVSAWEQCEVHGPSATSPTYCPDGTMCCFNSGDNGATACVPVAKSSSPNTTKTGHCCEAEGEEDMSTNTACLSGYECVIKGSNDPLLQTTRGSDLPEKYYCRATNQAKREDPNAHDVPRYQTCHMSDASMLRLHGFPMQESPSTETFHLGYYSNMGSITETNTTHDQVTRAVIILHGSLRDADDYFCTGLTLLDEDEAANDDVASPQNTLILVPWFASVSDEMDHASIVPGSKDTNQRHNPLIPKNILIWKDVVQAYDWYHWHLWRYGADADNADISSFTALDRMVEHVSASFPKLEQITVAGHSAGGQMAHRWALLSKSPAWYSTTTSIRAVVANPRSYLYLDDRRWFPSFCSETDDCTQSFQRPSQEVRNLCPEYNLYYWGLENGGDLSCPYRNSAMTAVNDSASAMAIRYASRDVIYLSGGYDIIPQYHDHCAALWQGRTRNERARNYFTSLQEYFGHSVHELLFVPFSAHDHALMFQSAVGRAAILGKQTSKNAQEQQKGNLRKEVSQTSRFIHPIDETDDDKS